MDSAAPLPASAPSLGPSDRLRLRPAAIRPVGPDLLIALPGPWRDVERLTGSGPLLWRLFGDGLPLAEVARRAAAEAGALPDAVAADVAAFGAELVARGLARPV